MANVSLFMDILTELLKENSKAVMTSIAKYIGSNESRFAELMKLFLGNESRVTQRAAWVLSYCIDYNKELILPYIDLLLDNLDNKVNNAVKRNTFRVLQYIDIPNQYEEKCLEIGFKYFNNKNEAIAIRVFSLTVLANIARKYPDLKEELKLLIEDELPYSKPAFASRGKSILKEFKSNKFSSK